VSISHGDLNATFPLFAEMAEEDMVEAVATVAVEAAGVETLISLAVVAVEATTTPREAEWASIPRQARPTTVRSGQSTTGAWAW
jgi:hypothetical protein